MSAQNAPAWEVSGGYIADAHFDGGKTNGYAVGLQRNVNRWLGGVFEFGDSFNDVAGLQQRFTTFMVGPQFTYRTGGRLQPFVRVLVGGAYGKASATGPSDTGAALGGGGGFDVRIKRNLYVRANADFLHASLFHDDTRYIQPGVGIVYYFGGMASSRQ
jgi:hypothetical protein